MNLTSNPSITDLRILPFFLLPYPVIGGGPSLSATLLRAIQISHCCIPASTSDLTVAQTANQNHINHPLWVNTQIARLYRPHLIVMLSVFHHLLGS